MISPSQASSSWRIFSSARLGSWPFCSQLGIKKWPKRAEISISAFLITKKGLKMNSLSMYQSIQLQKHLLSYIISLKLPWKWFWSWYRHKIRKFTTYWQKNVSSVSARRLKCSSSARLGTLTARLELEKSSSGSSLVRTFYSNPFWDTVHCYLSISN